MYLTAVYVHLGFTCAVLFTFLVAVTIIFAEAHMSARIVFPSSSLATPTLEFIFTVTAAEHFRYLISTIN